MYDIITMVILMTYKDYIERKKAEITHTLDSALLYLVDTSSIESVLDDALSEYENITYTALQELYKTEGITPELWNIEHSIQKIKNPDTRKKLSDQIWN